MKTTDIVMQHHIDVDYMWWFKEGVYNSKVLSTDDSHVTVILSWAKFMIYWSYPVGNETSSI